MQNKVSTSVQAQDPTIDGARLFALSLIHPDLVAANPAITKVDRHLTTKFRKFLDGGGLADTVGIATLMTSPSLPHETFGRLEALIPDNENGRMLREFLACWTAAGQAQGHPTGLTPVYPSGSERAEHDDCSALSGIAIGSIAVSRLIERLEPTATWIDFSFQRPALGNDRILDLGGGQFATPVGWERRIRFSGATALPRLITTSIIDFLGMLPRIAFGSYYWEYIKQRRPRAQVSQIDDASMYRFDTILCDAKLASGTIAKSSRSLWEAPEDVQWSKSKVKPLLRAHRVAISKALEPMFHLFAGLPKGHILVGVNGRLTTADSATFRDNLMGAILDAFLALSDETDEHKTEYVDFIHEFFARGAASANGHFTMLSQTDSLRAELAHPLDVLSHERTQRLLLARLSRLSPRLKHKLPKSLQSLTGRRRALNRLFEELHPDCLHPQLSLFLLFPNGKTLLNFYRFATCPSKPKLIEAFGIDRNSASTRASSRRGPRSRRPCYWPM